MLAAGQARHSLVDVSRCHEDEYGPTPVTLRWAAGSGPEGNAVPDPTPEPVRLLWLLVVTAQRR